MLSKAVLWSILCHLLLYAIVNSKCHPKSSDVDYINEINLKLYLYTFTEVEVLLLPHYKDWPYYTTVSPALLRILDLQFTTLTTPQAWMPLL